MNALLAEIPPCIWRVAPFATRTLPVPSAVLDWILTTPLFINVDPKYVLSVNRVKVPVPFLIKDPVPKEIELALTSIFPAPVNVTSKFELPIPPFKDKVPAVAARVEASKRLMAPFMELSPAIFNRDPPPPVPTPNKIKALSRVIPPCNSSSAPSNTVTNELVPNAPLLWMFKMPLFTFVTPEKVLAVVSVRIPDPD
jgi:hypothetical protein